MSTDVPHKPAVMLAPMAGITDRPFRDLVLRFGATRVTSEMVASREMVTARPGTREKAELGAGVRATAVQLAGRDPAWMAEAARMVADQGAEIIDINMGCPAKKVTNGYSGSALMRDPDLALRLVEAVVGAVEVPVTLKMRLGWDEECLNAPELARQAEAAGVRMIAVHGRTRCQFYRGTADWRAIRRVVDSVRIPVIANGDIVDAASARRALDLSGAAGVMVGRAARGRPWLVSRIAAALEGRVTPAEPRGGALVDLVASHYEAMVRFYGDIGPRVARKHLGWYMDGAGTEPGLRRHVLTETRPDHVVRLLADALSDRTRTAA